MLRTILWIILAFYAVAAHAHGEADWINRGAIKNSVGELCCGENDCRVTTAQTVSDPMAGYRIPSGQFIRQDDAQPSPDGQFWVCIWGGQVRCFFAPIPTY